MSVCKCRRPWNQLTLWRQNVPTPPPTPPVHLPPPCPSWPLALGESRSCFFPRRVVLPILELHVNWIVWRVFFGICFSLQHKCLCGSSVWLPVLVIPLDCRVTFYGRIIIYLFSVHLVKDTWVTSGSGSSRIELVRIFSYRSQREHAFFTPW